MVAFPGLHGFEPAAGARPHPGAVQRAARAVQGVPLLLYAAAAPARQPSLRARTPTQVRTHPLTHPPTRSLTHSLAHSLTHSLTPSPTRSLTHFTYLLTVNRDIDRLAIYFLTNLYCFKYETVEVYCIYTIKVEFTYSVINLVDYSITHLLTQAFTHSFAYLYRLTNM